MFVAQLNKLNGTIHFDLSSPVLEKIMVRPGRARQYADTFFEMLLNIAPSLPVKIEAANNLNAGT